MSWTFIWTEDLFSNLQFKPGSHVLSDVRKPFPVLSLIHIGDGPTKVVNTSSEAQFFKFTKTAVFGVKVNSLLPSQKSILMVSEMVSDITSVLTLVEGEFFLHPLPKNMLQISINIITPAVTERGLM